MKTYKTFISFFILLLFAFLPVKAQQVEEYDIRYFTTADGLSNNTVEAILQDSRGFIWTATTFGLNRFDGHEFKVFTKRKNNLASNLVNKIWEDAAGFLWLSFRTNLNGDYNSLSIFDPKKEQSILFDQYFPKAPFQMENIQVVNSDNKRNIWMVLKDGSIYRYQNDFKLFAKNKKWEKAIAIEILAENNIWLTQEYSLTNIGADGKELRTIKSSYKAIKQLGELGNNKLWAQEYEHYDLLKNSIKTYDENGVEEPFPFDFTLEEKQKSFISNLVEDENKNLQFWHLGVNMLMVTNTEGQRRDEYKRIRGI